MKITLSVLFSLFFVLAFNTCYSQALFTPLTDNEAMQQSLLKALNTQYEKDIAAVKDPNKKYILALYKERYDDIKELIDDKRVVTFSKANDYLQQILNEIVKHNPELQNLPVRVSFSKDYWPNAVSMGEGTIFFNIGLFNRLNNESQACFVLCHELAHLYLNHGNNAINRYVTTLYSKDFQDELKSIKKSEYGKREKLEGLIKNITFNSRKHGREFESQADSMAVEFMKNTNYDLQESLTCLTLLDSVDNDKYNISPALDTVFNSNAYPFQQRWVKEEKNLFNALAQSNIEQNAKDKDSLKTHPDCATRVRSLTPLVDKYYSPTGKKFVGSEDNFNELRRMFDYEIIEYCYQTTFVSRSLYYSLQMLYYYPGDPYLVANVGRCFNKMYNAQVSHTLGKITDMPSPYNEDKYNYFLQFLSKLRLADLAAINYYYLEHFTNDLAGNKDFIEQKNTARKNLDSN